MVGICNGFQVLTEAGLLPGRAAEERRLRFLCEPAALGSPPTASVLTARREVGEELADSRSTTSRATTRATTRPCGELDGEGRVVLRYVDNPNGSVDDIAGIANAAGNVVGLMPHPERAADALLGSADGVVLLRSLPGRRRHGARRSLSASRL